MAEKYTDKTEYMAALRDRTKIAAITEKVDVKRADVAETLYKRLKAKPSYFETEIGRKFIQQLFITSEGAKRSRIPANPPKDPEELLEEKSREAENEAAQSRSFGDRFRDLTGKVAKKPEKEQKENTVNKAANSKIHIVDGPKELTDVYNSFEQSVLRREHERRKALDDILNSDKEYNEFWDDEPEAQEPEEEQKKKKRLKKVLIAVGAVAAIILAVTLTKEITYRIENYKSKQKLAQLQELVTQAQLDAELNKKEVTPVLAAPTEVPAEPTAAEEPAEPTPSPIPTVLAEYAELYARNSDMVGWIRIPDTVVNYPVMQTRSEMEYYLLRDFDKNDDKNGLPFVDSRSDVFEPTTNVIIYGHCMNSGAMFATLLNYKDEAYYKEHPIIYFDTIYEHAEYEIIACFQSKVAYIDEKVFRYYAFIDTEVEEEFDEFVANVRSLAYYDTGVTAEFGDSLITLSTCDKEISNGRMVVVARKISN